MGLASATSSLSFLSTQLREALQHEQASEQLVSRSQGGLSSTTGHRPLETLLSIMKELPWTPALVIRLLVVHTTTTQTSTAAALAQPQEPTTRTLASSLVITKTASLCTDCAKTPPERL